MVATKQKGSLALTRLPLQSGAGNESRTRDLNLGKVALYQLSYSRNLQQRRDSIENVSVGQGALGLCDHARGALRLSESRQRQLRLEPARNCRCAQVRTRDSAKMPLFAKSECNCAYPSPSNESNGPLLMARATHGSSHRLHALRERKVALR
jgi:hypothetical protein